MMQVPEGWKLVPIEPTAEMVTAGRKQVATGMVSGHLAPKAKNVYAAMLAAAPTALPVQVVSNAAAMAQGNPGQWFEQAQPQVAIQDAQPVAEVVNKYGDPEEFAERDLKMLVLLQTLPIGTKLYTAPQSAGTDTAGFKNFHRALCERFGYTHDEENWSRDQASLIEHIAAAQSVEAREPLSEAAADLLVERRRQVEVEGWTSAHDDKHVTGAMALAASRYALAGSSDGRVVGDELEPALSVRLWPRGWADKYFKPGNRRHNLIRAGALILAEIERLDRSAAANGAGKP